MRGRLGAAFMVMAIAAPPVIITLLLSDVYAASEVYLGRAEVLGRSEDSQLRWVVHVKLGDKNRTALVSRSLWYKLDVGDLVELVQDRGVLFRGRLHVRENGATVLRLPGGLDDDPGAGYPTKLEVVLPDKPGVAIPIASKRGG